MIECRECGECGELEDCSPQGMIECAEDQQMDAAVWERLTAYVLRDPSVLVVSDMGNVEVVG